MEYFVNWKQFYDAQAIYSAQKLPNACGGMLQAPWLPYSTAYGVQDLLWRAFNGNWTKYRLVGFCNMWKHQASESMLKSPYKSHYLMDCNNDDNSSCRSLLLTWINLPGCINGKQYFGWWIKAWNGSRHRKCLQVNDRVAKFDKIKLTAIATLLSWDFERL